jgi:hypothetical protein
MRKLPVGKAKFELKIYQLHIALCLHRRHGFSPLSLDRLAESRTTKKTSLKKDFRRLAARRRNFISLSPAAAAAMCSKLILNYISIHPDCVRFFSSSPRLLSSSFSFIKLFSACSKNFGNLFYSPFRLAAYCFDEKLVMRSASRVEGGKSTAPKEQ